MFVTVSPSNLFPRTKSPMKNNVKLLNFYGAELNKKIKNLFSRE